jgi:hypothetical protein
VFNRKFPSQDSRAKVLEEARVYRLMLRSGQAIFAVCHDIGHAYEQRLMVLLQCLQPSPTRSLK